jgi:hypothetical protein
MFNQKGVHCQIFRKRQRKKAEEVLTLVFLQLLKLPEHIRCV